MHWRTPFPPKRPTVLAELIAVMRASLHPAQMMGPHEAALLDELPPALDMADTVEITAPSLPAK